MRDLIVPIPWPELDPTTIAPCKNGAPDLYNHMPSRFVPLAEAKARGWKYLFANQPCRYGHVAPRFVSNPRVCVDCYRIKDGKPTIGTKAPVSTARPYKQREAKPETPAAPVVIDRTPTEPDASEKKFLESYALTRDLDSSSKAVKLTRAQIEGRMAYNAIFRDAVNELEQRLGIKPTAPAAAQYVWDDAKRARLIEVWVDTGDIATARESIGVTPSEYLRELDRNETFTDEVKAAEPKAERMLEERAYQLALAGNDKLLTKILTAKKPEYRESLKVDMNVNPAAKMSDEQLRAHLLRLMTKHGPQIIDAEFVEEPVKQIEAEPAKQIEKPVDDDDIVGILAGL